MDAAVLSDAYLDDLVGSYVKSAKLAQKSGFDGVDIKACHRYLLSELLASHTRGGKYGGSLENRTKLLLCILREIKKEVGADFILSSRFNVFDAHPYPYGFGCGKKDMWKFEPEESIYLAKAMACAGVNLLSNSAGNPYYIYPQVTRPFDASSAGIPVPEEHPLESIARLFLFTQTIQRAVPHIPVVGNGYTWLRQFLPFAGAYNLQQGKCSFVGLGRSSFAYPDLPRDVLQKGSAMPEKCCVSCSKCTQLMRDGRKTGCVVKDASAYSMLNRAI